MADFSGFQISVGNNSYPATYNAFVAALQAYATEVENAREGQLTLLANNLRYIKAAAGLTQAFPANGYRITGLPTPAANDEPATKGYADALAFAAALPAQPGNAGLEITTNGTVASWGLTAPGAIGILNMINFFG